MIKVLREIESKKRERKESRRRLRGRTSSTKKGMLLDSEEASDISPSVLSQNNPDFSKLLVN